MSRMHLKHNKELIFLLDTIFMLLFVTFHFDILCKRRSRILVGLFARALLPFPRITSGELKAESRIFLMK